MRLVDLDPEWVTFDAASGGHFGYSDVHSHVDYDADADGNVDAPESSIEFAHADGVAFMCPTCYAKKGSNIGVETVICWFKNRPNVPADATPGPGRWTATGTSFDDLTLSPSVNVDHEHWHGYVTNGEIK